MVNKMVIAKSVFDESGKEVVDLMTADQVVAEADLGWQVKMVPAVMDFGKTRRQSKKYRFIVREDTGDELGMVSPGYQPWQNAEAIGWVDQLIGKEVKAFSTAGYWDDGRRCWALLDLDQTMEVINGDPIKAYLFLGWGHGGGSAIDAGLQPVRVICANTYAAAKENVRETAKTGKAMSIRHTGDLSARVEQGRALIAGQLDFFGKWKEELAAMVAQTFDQEEAVQFALDVVQAARVTTRGIERKTVLGDLHEKQRPMAEKIIRLHEEGMGADIPGVKGTGYGLFNAVTEYIDHESFPQADARFKYSLVGGGADLKDYARKLATRELVLG